MYDFGVTRLKQHEHIAVDPPAAIPGAEVAIMPPRSRTRGEPGEFWFADQRGHVVAGSSKRALLLVPNLTAGGTIDIRLAKSGKRSRSPLKLIVGRKIAGGMHPVTNPAFDPADESLIVTRSGGRGEHVPVSLYRITPDGTINELSGDLTNPTGIAFDKKGQMFVTSRFDGSVYRLTPLKEVIEFSTDLGIATGLAFSREGEMFVGDRSGTIFRINEIGEANPWVHLEPSVSAYHLAFGPDDALYVTGPTVSSFESINRIDSQGQSTIFYRGLGRPQGLAFDREGNLYVAAALRGRRGIVRISPNADDARLFVAGMNVVGLAFNSAGDMIVATNDSVYSLPLGIRGTLLE